MIKLDSIQTDLVLTNLDENGALSCVKAFRVAKLIGMEPKVIAQIAREMNFKITNCELGVFGDLKFTDMNDDIYNMLKTNTNNSKIECQIAWKIAQEKNNTINQIGSTIKNSDLKVTKCQIGCFQDEENHGFVIGTD
ncbi:MAG: ModE family transcriptional regulator [Poseidonibacter sp.]